MNEELEKEIAKLAHFYGVRYITIDDFRNNADWFTISVTPASLSRDFLKTFEDKLMWVYISHYQKLSEDVIREFHDKVYWNSICCYQDLSESLIRDFQDRMFWGFIASRQIYGTLKLSDEFIKEFEEVLKPVELIFEDGSKERAFLTNFKVQLGSRIYNHRRAAFLIIVEMSVNGKEIYVERE